MRGLGKAKSAEILAVTELARRFMREEMRQPSWSFKSADDVRDYLLMQFKGQALEAFGVLFLNQQHGFIAFERLAAGAVAQVQVPVRALIASALHHHAAAVILAHNHPSGDPAPSTEDHRLTRVLKEAGNLLGIPVTDHVILGGNEFFSFAEDGVL